jgi:shikimate dehydrogenase
MTEDSGLKLFGVIGHPIRHSLSPLMHNAAFEAFGMHCSMQAFDIESQSLKDALQGFANLDFGGLNVTIPHKESIIPLLDEIDDEARLIGAVNTVQFIQKRLRGYNTDCIGFLKALEPFRSSINGTQFVILGAGGAARAAAYVLLKHFRTTQIVIASRSTNRAKDLIDQFKGINQAKLAAVSLSDAQLPRIVNGSDVIINATPAGMFPNIDEMPNSDLTFRNGQIVVDLIYRPLETKFLRRASNDGAITVSGLEVFVHQGARSFEIWTGRDMDVSIVRPALLQKLQDEASQSS